MTQIRSETCHALPTWQPCNLDMDLWTISQVPAWHIRRDGANSTVDQKGRAMEVVWSTVSWWDETASDRSVVSLLLSSCQIIYHHYPAFYAGRTDLGASRLSLKLRRCWTLHGSLNFNQKFWSTIQHGTRRQTAKEHIEEMFSEHSPSHARYD